MTPKKRRTIYYIIFVISITIIFTLVYNFGMATWEDRPQPIYHSLEVIIQTFTTTGYGEDAPWQTPQMNFLVILIQFSGIGIFLAAIDLFAVPWLRNTLTVNAPSSLPKIENHVIICGYTPRTETFVSELKALDYEYIFIEPDEEKANDLHEKDVNVIYGDPESTETLKKVHIDKARSVVTDISDEKNASITLSVREVNPEIQIVTLIENNETKQYLQVAGADKVLSPRQFLGESLATELSTAVTRRIDERVGIGEDFELIELEIKEDSEFCNKTFEEAELRQRFGVNIVGVWFDGNFHTKMEPETKIKADMRLLVAGNPEQLDLLRDVSYSTFQEFLEQKIIIAGYGEVGESAYKTISNTSSETTIIDIRQKEKVDIVGDILDPDVLIKAGIEDASAILITVEDDTAAVFATLIARDLNPDIRIVVRVNEKENIQKLYRAGADYVQSLATVSGRMLASTVVEEDVLVYGKQINIVRMPASRLKRKTLAEADVRAKTGCTVVAIHRGENIITDFDPNTFRFEEKDKLVLVGTDDNIKQFERHFTDLA